MKEIIVSCFLIFGCTELCAQWEIVDQDEDCIYTAVYFINDSVGFVIGNCGLNSVEIKRTEDFGETWSVVYSGVDGSILDIYFPSDTIGYCSTYDNVLKTIDGGLNWFYPVPDFIGYPYRSIVFQDEEIGFGCFADGGMAFSKTMDGGSTWIEQYDMGGRELLKIENCEVLMIGSYLRTTNNCWEDWNTIQLPNDERVDENLAFLSSGVLLSCGRGFNDETWSNFGFIGRSIDNGENWIFQDFETLVDCNSIVAIGQSTVYCGAHAILPLEYSILKSTDGGMTWNYQMYEIPCPTCYSPDIRDIYCTSEDICYAVNGTGSIWRTMNGGGELFPLPVGVTERINSGAELEIFPNPARNELNVRCNIPVEFVEIYDLTGRRVYSIETSSAEKELNLRLDQLNSGCYWISVYLRDDTRKYRCVHKLTN